MEPNVVSDKVTDPFEISVKFPQSIANVSYSHRIVLTNEIEFYELTIACRLHSAPCSIHLTLPVCWKWNIQGIADVTDVDSQ